MLVCMSVPFLAYVYVSDLCSRSCYSHTRVTNASEQQLIFMTLKQVFSLVERLNKDLNCLSSTKTWFSGSELAGQKSTIKMQFATVMQPVLGDLTYCVFMPYFSLHMP